MSDELTGARRLDRNLALHGLAALLAIVYFSLLSWFSIASQHALTTQMNDLGNAVQAIWSGTQGDPLLTVSNDVDGAVKSRLAVHTNVLYFALVPLYALFPRPELLAIVATLACALAGLGVYAHARRHGAEIGALLLLAAFYLHPMVHDANVFDFKIVTIATAALVWSLWAFDAERTVLGCALAAIVLLSQEDHALLVVGLGVYLMLTGRRKLGAAVSAAAIVYLLVMLGLVVPAIYGDELARMEGSRNRLAWLADAGIFDVVRHLLRPDRLRLPLYLLASTGAAAVLAPRFLVIVAPLVIGAMLSGSPWMTQLAGTYYHLPAIAVLLVASATIASRQSARRWIPGVAAASLAASLLLSPLPHSAVATWENYQDASDIAVLRSIDQRLGPASSISAQNNLGVWFAHRRDIAAFPRRHETADYLVFRLRCDFGPSSGLFVRTSPTTLFMMSPAELSTAVERAILSPDWCVVAGGAGIWVLGRNATPCVPRDAALFHVRNEAGHMRRRCAENLARVTPWRRLVVGSYSWSELPEAFPRL